MNLTNASRFRRTVAGLLLLIGPMMILIASIVDPATGEGGETKDYLTAIKNDPDMAQVATVLWMWGFALTAIGIIGLVHVIRRRGVVLAHLGGALAVFGMIMFMALFATTIFELNTADKLGVDTAERLSKDLEDYWAPIVILVPALLGTFIGFILLGAAIIRSKVAHIAAGILIIVGIIGVVLTGEASKIPNIIANVLLSIGWGIVGLKLLGMKDEQWDGRAPLDGEGPGTPLAGGTPSTGGSPPPAAPPPAVP